MSKREILGLDSIWWNSNKKKRGKLNKKSKNKNRKKSRKSRWKLCVKNCKKRGLDKSKNITKSKTSKPIFLIKYNMILKSMKSFSTKASSIVRYAKSSLKVKTSYEIIKNQSSTSKWSKTFRKKSCSKKSCYKKLNKWMKNLKNHLKNRKLSNNLLRKRGTKRKRIKINRIKSSRVKINKK